MRRKRVSRRWFWAGVILALLIAAGWLSHRMVQGYVRQQLDRELADILPQIEKKTGLLVTVGGIAMSLDGTGELRDVSVSARDKTGQPFFTVESIDIEYELDWGERRARVTGLLFGGPSLTVDFLPEGGTNLPAFVDRLLGADYPTANVAVEGDGGLRTLAGGRVTLPERLPIRYRNGSLTVRDRGRFGKTEQTLSTVHKADGNIVFHLDDKTARLEGRCGQPHGGKLQYKVSLHHAGQDVALNAVRWSLADLSAVAPPYIQLSESTRLNGSLELQRRNDDPVLHVAVDGRMDGLTLEHFRLARQPVRNIQGGIAGKLVIDTQKNTVGSHDLVLSLGRAEVHLQEFHVRAGENLPFELRTKIRTARLDLQDLLDGLPEGLVPSLQGAIVEGELDLNATLVVDMENIRESALDIKGGISGFRAISVPPPVDVRRVKRPDFRHVIVRKGVFKREIIVGPSNPGFVPYAATGHYLRGAVLTCEDGSFFRHNGFMLRHINDSLRRNLRDKRFSRGASTVSMQLVKNLFLSHDKTVSRKLQEAMLTWWIEKEVDKQRLLEVYLNIIEWGPDIYGVGPASRHYFHRHPSKLLPIQAAWMASIISNPVRFYYMKARGSVGAGWKTNLAFIMQKMRERGTITQEDYDLAAEYDFWVPFGSADYPSDKEEDGNSAAEGDTTSDIPTP
ncbi:MAG: biosynthetic peptidoglycan transglycosylase [Candidatus Lernaella stagnicola]|nr:biosynthetic peptidoglycan transglycosylase [Candidatus Lernaella stagnicola]